MRSNLIESDRCDDGQTCDAGTRITVELILGIWLRDLEHILEAHPRLTREAFSRPCRALDSLRIRHQESGMNRLAIKR